MTLSQARILAADIRSSEAVVILMTVSRCKPRRRAMVFGGVPNSHSCSASTTSVIDLVVTPSRTSVSATSLQSVDVGAIGVMARIGLSVRRRWPLRDLGNSTPCSRVVGEAVGAGVVGAAAIGSLLVADAACWMARRRVNDSNANVAWAMETSIDSGHNQAMPRRTPALTASSQSESKLSANAQPASPTVMASAAQ